MIPQPRLPRDLKRYTLGTASHFSDSLLRTGSGFKKCEMSVLTSMSGYQRSNRSQGSEPSGTSHG